MFGISRMKHRLIIAALTLLLLPVAAFSQSGLSADVRKILQNKALREDRVGVEIIRLGASGADARTLFQHNATTPLIPASNLKLVTTAAALELLGSDFRFRTVLAVRGDQVAIVGDGDPTFGDSELLRKVGWNVDTVLRRWVDVLKKRGIRRVDTVHVDDSVFDEVFVHPSWPPEQQHKKYVAQVGGLNLNVNCVDFFLTTGAFGDTVSYTTAPATSYVSVSNICTFGHKNAVWLARDLGRNTVILRGETNASNREPISVTVHDPGMYAGTVFAETLRAEGLRVIGEVVRTREIRAGIRTASDASAEPWVPVAIHETPIAPVLARANKDSVNLYAEALAKRIGYSATGQSGSWQNGAAAIGGYLESIGVSSAEFTLDDGSGLSKKNAISANAIAKVLAHTFAGPNRQAFLDSLSIAGEDGTLNRRFRDTDLRGRVFAKSGYVQGVSSLSGYVQASDGQWYAFSILMNGVSDIATARMIQEKIVAAIDRHSK